MDISDSGSIAQSLKIAQPKEIFHLASQSFVAASFSQPIYTSDITGLGTTRILEEIRRFDLGVHAHNVWVEEEKVFTCSAREGKVIDENEKVYFESTGYVRGAAFDPTTGSLWASRGNSSGGNRRQIILDPTTAAALFLLDINTSLPATGISFDADGTLYASLGGNQLAIIDKETGQVTLIGTVFGGPKISGLGFGR